MGITLSNKQFWYGFIAIALIATFFVFFMPDTGMNVYASILTIVYFLWILLVLLTILYILFRIFRWIYRIVFRR